MSKPAPVRMTYFGKLPSRGDFVKADHDHRLLSALDEWLANTMERMSSDPRWKITYDAATPQHFSLLGSRRRIAVAGHLVNSHDQSGRRFPFITASALPVDKPLAFAAHSPLALSRLWAHSQAFTRQLLSSEDCATALENINKADVSVAIDADTYAAHYADFLRIQSLGALQETLQKAGHAVDLQNLVPALGLLLQPVLVSGATQLDKGLVLPLPDDPIHRYSVAALWMDLITPFLAGAEIEFSVFIGAVEKRTQMVCGFSATPATTLHSVLDPEVSARHNITLLNPEWVQAQIDGDYGLQKLKAYLARPGISLRLARDTFRDVFLGD